MSRPPCLRALVYRVRPGRSLAEILFVIILLIAITSFFLPNFVRRGGATQTANAVQAAASDTVCQANLMQVRQAIAVYKMNDRDGKNPPGLAAVNLSGQGARCPAGQEAYMYSPQDGQARCPHPGHETF